MKPVPRLRPSTATLALALAALITACEADRRRAVADPDRRDAVEDAAIAPPLELSTSAYELALNVALDAVEPREEHGLHNVYALGESIVSGSEPHGEAAFRELQAMGVRTILSVDGKVPDAELAERHGMTYVHVPIQYRGITPDELARIAKTFREQEGPFYVHCFHGKHRGPAAAEVGRLVLDGISREQALAEMVRCGTSSKYEGLYRTIAEAHIPDRAETEGYAWGFPAAHPFEGFRQAMVEVSRVEDHLERLALGGWTPSAEHPDLDALNEAERLASALARSAELQPEGAADDFRGWMDDSVRSSVELRDALAAWRAGDGSLDAVDVAYDGLAQSCAACHDAYRND